MYLFQFVGNDSFVKDVACLLDRVAADEYALEKDLCPCTINCIGEADPERWAEVSHMMDWSLYEIELDAEAA